MNSGVSFPLSLALCGLHCPSWVCDPVAISSLRLTTLSSYLLWKEHCTFSRAWSPVLCHGSLLPAACWEDGLFYLVLSLCERRCEADSLCTDSFTNSSVPKGVCLSDTRSFRVLLSGELGMPLLQWVRRRQVPLGKPGWIWGIGHAAGE